MSTTTATPPDIAVFERGWLSSNNILLHGGEGEDATLFDSGYVLHAEQTLALVRHALRPGQAMRASSTPICTPTTAAAAVGAFGGYMLASVDAVINKRQDGRGRVFGLWLLLWSPALAAVAWFILHGEGFAALPVPMALGTAGVVGMALWAAPAYKQAGLQTEVKESVFLTAKTSAMVCWLFVGSAIFSAAFALPGGQELVER